MWTALSSAAAARDLPITAQTAIQAVCNRCYTTDATAGRRAQAAVEAWSPQDVGAWAKSQGLPKGVRNALKPVSGKVLIEMTLEDFAALFEKPPSSIYAKIFEDARQALQQRQQVERPPRHSAPPAPRLPYVARDRGRLPMAADARSMATHGQPKRCRVTCRPPLMPVRRSNARCAARAHSPCCASG